MFFVIKPTTVTSFDTANSQKINLWLSQGIVFQNPFPYKTDINTEMFDTQSVKSTLQIKKISTMCLSFNIYLKIVAIYNVEHFISYR